MKTTTEQVNNKQSFCWHCGRKLAAPYFDEVTDPIGNKHKVHKICKKDSEEWMKPQ